MSALNRSALNRVGRSVMQGVLAFVTVEAATDWLSDMDLTPEQMTVATLLVKFGLAYLHRRFLDSTPLPSLVDGEAGEPTTPEYQGRRVASDGKGLT